MERGQFALVPVEATEAMVRPISVQLSPDDGPRYVSRSFDDGTTRFNFTERQLRDIWAIMISRMFEERIDGTSAGA